MGLDIATASLLDGEFGLYEGVDEKRRLERSSTRDPIVTLVGTEVSLCSVGGVPKMLLAKHPFWYQLG
jgi:hypothetical protein